MTPGKNPREYGHADFTAALAAETGLSPSELTRRSDPRPESTDDPLLPRAREANEKRPEVGQVPETLRPIADQFADQIEVMKEFGEVGEFDNLEGIKAVDGRFYIPPREEDFMRLLAEKADILEPKVEQGFRKLILVPLAEPVDRLVERYGEALRAEDKNQGLLGPSGERLELDTNEPVWVWDPLKEADIAGDLVYNPESFEENHGGVKKDDLFVSETPGWQILLVEEDMSNIPKLGQGKTVGGRPQLECGQNSEEYLRILRGDPAYQNEVGLTLEAYLAMAMTELKENRKVLDHETYTALVGSYLPGQRRVPVARWSPAGRQLDLDAGVPDYSRESWGVRSAVRVS